MAPYLTLGAQLAAAVLIMFFVGRWLDAKLNTSPWCMVGGLMFGIGAGLFQFIRTVLDLAKKEEK
ncbi:MAG TPA: AtpZ/AtpI family protein [Bacteroidota bacterium]|nr:AtpZ/AtpI family protein [Bacteroidota bacterium]